MRQSTDKVSDEARLKAKKRFRAIASYCVTAADLVDEDDNGVEEMEFLLYLATDMLKIHDTYTEEAKS